MIMLLLGALLSCLAGSSYWGSRPASRAQRVGRRIERRRTRYVRAVVRARQSAVV